MSFGSFLLATLLYLSLSFVFVSVFLHVLSFRYRNAQNQMLYYPELPPESRESCEDPVALGIPFAERVTVRTADHVRLRGFILWPGPVPPPAIANSGSSSGRTSGAGSHDTSPHLGSSNNNNAHDGVMIGSPNSSAPITVVVPGSPESGATTATAAVGVAESVTMGTTTSSSATPRFVLLYFHGNAGNVGHRLSLAQAYVSQLQCAVMMVDYRGFGLSDAAELTQEGLELDAQACFEHLWQDPRVPRDRIVVMGTSLGGAVAIHLAAKERCGRRMQAVIVENTFTSIGDMASALGRPIVQRLVTRCPGLAMNVFEYYIKPLALRIAWRSVRKVRSITAPMLFLSGVRDELVPPEQMRALYKESMRVLRDERSVELAVPLRRFQEFAGGMHNNLPLMPGYMGVIRKFMVDVSNGAIAGIV